MKRKLLLMMVALLSIVGVRQVHAYTVEDLKSAGWSEVTDLSALTLNDNYFILIDAGTSKYAVSNSRPGTESKPTYQELQDPEIDHSQVWIISSENSAYYLQSIVDEWYFIGAAASGQGWTDKMAVVKDNGNFEFSYSEGKYSIKSIFANGLVGPWNDNGAVDLSNKLEWGAIEDNYYEELACNKSATQAPGFYLFSISITKYEENRYYSGTLEKEGWSKVTSVDGLGLSGYYYTFLDASELGYETGLMLTGIENARHQYQLTEDPIKEKSKLWTTEAHGIGYALKNASYDKYLYCWEPWETSSTNDINTNNTDFSFKLNDGKWELSNAISTSQFVGRWGTSAYNPGVGEQIPANKAAEAGKRLFAIYSIPTIAGVATQLPEGGVMEANTWYYVNIAVEGKYNATATNLSDIVYTTDGTTLVRDASSIADKFNAENDLTVSCYYVMSTSENNLTVVPASYEYIVGSASANFKYIQPGNTVTVSYADLATNDSEAGLTISLEGVTVSNATITCEATANGFTFVVPEDVEANTEYILSIPEKTIGYSKVEEYNKKQDITLMTPAVFDGKYFLKDANNKYLSRGKSWGTCAIADDYGVPFLLQTNGEGISAFVFMDSKLNLFDADGQTVFCDNSEKNLDWSVEAVSGGYNIVNKNDNGSKDYKLYITEDEFVRSSNTASTIWTFESIKDHGVQMDALKDAQAANAAAKINQSGITTKAELAELLETFEKISIPVIGGEADVFEKVSPTVQDYVPYDVFPKETVENLTPGLYKLSVQAFYRITNNDDTYNAEGAPGLVYVYANNVKTQLVSPFSYGSETKWDKDDYPAPDGLNYPNNVSGAKAAFAAGHYVNDVYVYVEDEGEGKGSISFGIQNPSRVNGRSTWVYYGNFNLTYYCPLTVEITEAGYATFSSGYALNLDKLPAGLEAYYVVAANINNGDGETGYVTLTEATGLVAAGEGLLVKGNAGTYNIPLADSGEEISGNILKAGDGSSVGAGNYVFSCKKVEGEEKADPTTAGFYKLGADTVVPEGKAYLDASELPSHVKALRLVFGDDTATAIETIEAADAEVGGTLYNVAGQQVGEDYKGIVIKNGKKYLNK